MLGLSSVVQRHCKLWFGAPPQDLTNKEESQPSANFLLSAPTEMLTQPAGRRMN